MTPWRVELGIVEFDVAGVSGMLTLRAWGRFRLLDAAGVDYSPRAQKARGLLVLLAFSPGYSRGRIWLQNKLWSDRGSDQASASLRQALSDIRRQLGPHGAMVRGDRRSVSLDAALFQISFEQPASAGVDVELFEDLDLSDPRFEDWIRRRRLETANSYRDDLDHSPSKPILLLARRKMVAFVADCGGSGPARHLVSKFFALTSKAIGAQVDSVSFCETGNITECETFDGAAQAVAVRSVVRDGAPRGSLSVTISDASSGCVFWAESTQLVLDTDGSAISSEFYSIVSRAADAAVDALLRGNGSADGHGLALRLFNSARLLTMTLDKENLALADRQCAAAFEMSPHGGPLAWRALIRQISHFQYMTCDFLPYYEPAEVLAARALEAFPGDSMAQCMGAHTEYLFGGNPWQAMRLAKRSIEANPLSALAWAALSNLQTAMSDYCTGYDSALRAIDLSAGTRAAYFFEFYGCIAASGLGDYQSAMRHARTAAKLAPNFAPPRRYLVALKASTNDDLGFRRALQELRHIEPSFEMKLLLDGSYPVNTMRRISLIDNIEGRLRTGMAGFLERH